MDSFIFLGQVYRFVRLVKRGIPILKSLDPRRLKRDLSDAVEAFRKRLFPKGKQASASLRRKVKFEDFPADIEESLFRLSKEPQRTIPRKEYEKCSSETLTSGP